MDAGRSQVGSVDIELGAPGSGVTAWTLAAVDSPWGPGPGEIDGLPTTFTEDPPARGSPGGHPNGVVALDHVVVTTPHLEATVAGLARLGLTERRRRDAGRGDRPTTQVFFRLGEAILELVGSPEVEEDGPSRFWGLAFTVSDMDLTMAALGDRLRDVKAAVQPGRFIASLDRAAGSSVPIAFMTAGS